MKNLKCVIWSLRALIGRLRPSNKSMVICVNEAGTLPSLIASHLKYRIVELTLIGELNGTDLRYIREMSGCDANGKETGGCLSVLDLSGVNIVDGGNTYYGNYSASDNKIGDYTFYKCARLTRVIMPDNLLSIGEGAFGCCYNLSSVVIPDKVRDIGELAFYRCESLGVVSIGCDVNTIGVYAFRSCISLKEAIFVDGNKPLQVGDNLFYNCPLEKLYVGRDLKFENFSFGKTKTLMTVVFGKEVTCIGDHLFMGCLRLKDIYIEAPIPPAVADGFNPSILSEVVLHVPGCSRVIYAERFPWSDFVSIQTF